MQNLIQISHKVQELRGFSLAGKGQTNGWTNEWTRIVIIVQTKGRAILRVLIYFSIVETQVQCGQNSD